MTNPTLFNKLFIWPIINVLLVFYKFFLLVKIPGALGWAVISMTLLIRLILHPFSKVQLENVQKMAKLKPTLDKLAKKHKTDKMRLQQEQLRLYKEAGVNPTLGCLPMLLQLPILIGLYNVFFQVLSNDNMPQLIGAVNQIIYFPLLKIDSFDLSFFGLNLSNKPSEWRALGIWWLLVPIVTGGLQYLQTKMMAPVVQKPAVEKTHKIEKKKKDKGKEEDMSVIMQKQMSVMMPVMIGFFAYSFPLGLSLYWNTFTIFGIIHQYKLNKQLTQKHGRR